MDIIYESAQNFKKLENVKYNFVFVQNRKMHKITLDFMITDFKHAAGLQYITDIAIEKNPAKLIDSILSDNKYKITDEKLSKSYKYKEELRYAGSVQERVSDIRYLEKCLDTSDFMRINKIQTFGSWITAEYFIEAFCREINSIMYIFLRKRAESDNYVIVSFFRKKTVFQGISTYWMLKEKITEVGKIELYRSSTYKEKIKS